MSDAADPKANIVIGADDTPLRRALTALRDHMQAFGRDSGKAIEGISSPLEALRGKFLMVSGLLGGGALFGKAVRDTVEYTESSIRLGKALGTSASGASVWIGALEDVGATTDELSTASRGLLRQVRENEKGLNAMGLATRDAGGHLRPMNDLVLDAIKLTNDYRAGTDRQVAATQIWGKGLDVSSNLLKLNSDAVRENAELMKSLGLVVSKEMVEAYEQNDSAMDQSALVMKALTTAVGNALIPVLTKLGEWFVNIGPGAVVVIKGAIGGLVSVFWGLKNSVAIAFEFINVTVITVAEPIRALASSLWKLVTGDFKGAAQEMSNWPSRVGEAWKTAWANMVSSSAEAREKIYNLFADGTEAGAAPSGDKKAKVPSKGDPVKPPAEASFMRYYEAMLAEERRAQSVLSAGREFSKSDELAYWRFIADTAQLTSKDRVAILRRMSDLEVDITRKRVAEQRAVEAEDLQAAQRLALAKIDTEEMAAQAALNLGQITGAQMATLQIGFEQQRYEITLAWLQERLRLLANDPDSNPAEKARVLNEILLLEQQYRARSAALVAEARGAQPQARNSLAEELGDENTWGNMFNGILSRAWSWRSAMGSIYSSLRDIFLRTMIVEPMAQYAAGLARMLLVKLGFLSAERAAQMTASGTIAGIKTTEATTVVGANAAEAASGAASSVASIPYVGPILALAAMAAVFAAVMGLSRKSAAGGYDIPAGVNPVTQLHEEEMVLPSPLANAVRRMAGEDGAAEGGGGGGPLGVLQATPLPGGFWAAHESSFVRFFEDLQRNRRIRGPK